MPDLRTHDLYIPERGLHKPFVSVLACPPVIEVAWHRDAQGVHCLLDAEGRLGYGQTPDPQLWEVRRYERVLGGENHAYYEPLPTA